MKSRKIKEHTVERKLTAVDYLKNCIFWMNEYFEGRQSKEQFIKTIGITADHIRTILSNRSLLNSEPKAQECDATKMLREQKLAK